jgi:hypothetical protein
VKKISAVYCFIGIGHKEPGGGGGGEVAVWSARRGQQKLVPCCLGIHRARIEDTAGFAGGDDASGQADGKA